MNPLIEQKIHFGVIVTTRAFFSISLAADIRKKLLKNLKDSGYGTVIMPQRATPAGAVETLDDAEKYARFFREKRDTIHGIIVCLPNFGDEQGVIETLDRARLDVPVLVVAIDDDPGKLDMRNRRDSFCGKLSVCNNLYQYGIPFTNTRLHTCSLESRDWKRDLDRFGRVCRVVRGLDRVRIGAIGARPEAFNTVRFSEKLLQDSGIKVVTVDLSEIIAAADRLDAGARSVKDRIAAIRAYGKIPDRIDRKKLEKQARLSVAVGSWLAENRCAAGALQCWPSIQQTYGCAACVTMSMLGEEEKIPMACEMDVAGAVSMYCLLLASGKAPGFLDWNNNFGDDRDKCVMYHCGNFPKSFFNAPLEISSLDVLGTVFGEDACFGAVKGQAAPGAVTYARISTDDTAGVIKAYTGEGEITRDKLKGIQGASAVVKIDRLQDLLRHLCANGFEHHVAMARESCASVLEEALGNYLGWEIYRHE